MEKKYNFYRITFNNFSELLGLNEKINNRMEYFYIIEFTDDLIIDKGNIIENRFENRVHKSGSIFNEKFSLSWIFSDGMFWVDVTISRENDCKELDNLEKVDYDNYLCSTYNESLWGKYDPEKEVWREDRIGRKLLYPVSEDNIKEKSRVSILYELFLNKSNGEIFWKRPVTLRIGGK